MTSPEPVQGGGAASAAPSPRAVEAAELADEARAAVLVAQDTLARRDMVIVAWHGEGASLRQIGVAVGLSHAAVAKVVNRAESKPAGGS